VNAPSYRFGDLRSWIALGVCVLALVTTVLVGFVGR
jgi:hypothetical protein